VETDLKLSKLQNITVEPNQAKQSGHRKSPGCVGKIIDYLTAKLKCAGMMQRISAARVAALSYLKFLIRIKIRILNSLVLQKKNMKHDCNQNNPSFASAELSPSNIAGTLLPLHFKRCVKGDFTRQLF
jgi:ribosomal protein L16/L10AE